MKRVKFGQPGRAEFLAAESKAYNALKLAGFKPQGMDMNTNKLVVIKAENENTNAEKRKIYYFNTWQDAAIELLKQEGVKEDVQRA